MNKGENRSQKCTGRAHEVDGPFFVCLRVREIGALGVQKKASRRRKEAGPPLVSARASKRGIQGLWCVRVVEEIEQQCVGGVMSGNNNQKEYKGVSGSVFAFFGFGKKAVRAISRALQAGGVCFGGFDQSGLLPKNTTHKMGGRDAT